MMNGVPTLVQIGWLDQMFNFEGDSDTIIHIHPADTRSALDELTNKITPYQAQLDTEMNKGNIRNITLYQDKVNSLMEQRRALEQNYENLYYVQVGTNIYENDNIFFIGRGIDYALSMEGSLKLKEISYINSQAYAAGELKHGTISLIEEGTPVIGILTEEDLILKTISNIEEVKSRGAVTIGVTNSDINSKFDYKIEVPKVHKLLQPLLTVVPLQLISYEVAKLRECSIDQPKNLAKSVTVE